MQEKVSAIIPSKSTDNKVTLNFKEKSETTWKTSNELNGIFTDTVALTHNEKQATELVGNSILDKLAFEVQSNMNIDITGDSKLVTEALDISDNWAIASKENEILETAKEFLGVEYIWAANGPTAFDCSGYTCYVFKQNGITLPRYSGHQAKIGTTVDFDNLEKGDLVFFDTSKKHTGKVNHVGIFIGDNKFIHASSGGKKVMITSFNKKKFYKNRFLHGQRVVKPRRNFASLNTTKQNHL